MENKFDHVLEECLARLEAGDSLADCLASYPEHRNELRPMLEAAQMLGSMSQLTLRSEFRTGARARLVEHMHANPRRRGRFAGSRLALRYAASLAVLALAFTTAGTALAQRALPGDALYPWKLTSEGVWRSLQQNTVDADFYLAERRLGELHAVQGHPDLEALGMQAYSGVLRQLRTEVVESPDRVDWLNQLFIDHRAQLEDLFASSKADLPDPDELFSVIPLPGSDTNEDEQQGTPSNNENDSTLQIPLVITPLPVIKKENEDMDGEGASEAAEGFLEQAIDDLLGLP